MSDTAHAEIQAPAPKPRKRRAKRRHAAPKGPVKAPAEFAGMTEIQCCTACGPEKCVISGRPVCAHPMKGGLQPALFADREALARYERAKKVLAHRKIDGRG